MVWTEKFITPSRIDNFAKYLSGYKYNFGGDAFEEYSTEAFIDSLLKIEDPEKFLKADAGTAFHKLIETSEFKTLFVGEGFGANNDYIINGWTIKLDPTVNIELSVPVVREAVIKTSIAGLEIKGHVDSLDAIAVHDIKTTSKIDYDNYINSWQWRTYLVMTGLKKFVYDIFKVNVNESKKIVTIQGYERLEVYHYQGIEQEVSNMVIHYNKTLLALNGAIIKRINEYNEQIMATIEQLKSTTLITAKYEINNLIYALQNKYIFIEGLTV